METKSFFGENGLTSTSANHYCNLAKEVVRKYQNILANTRFYTTTVKVIGEEKENIISLGCTEQRLEYIKNAIARIAGLNSLTAFFREAMKEKERLNVEANNWKDKEAHADYDRRYAELEAEKPTSPVYLSTEDIIKTWTVGEQEKYLSLEAEAAVYGKYIHEDGALSKARVDMLNKMENPTSVEANGRDTLIYDYAFTVDESDIDKMFFELQAHHRTVQAELNGMKKRIEDIAVADMNKKDDEYRLAYQKWSDKKAEMERELQMLVQNENAKRMELREEVKNLKIVVPNRLQEVFDFLKSL